MFSLIGEWGESLPHWSKITYRPPTRKSTPRRLPLPNFYPPNLRFIPPPTECSHCSCTIFILPSYSLYTQVMLILILINVQYLQNVVFSFEKGSSGQNHSLSDSHQPVEKSHQVNFPSLLPLTTIWKTLGT